MNNNNNSIWLNNPSILFNSKKLGELWPTPNMNFEERLNAMTRLVILVTTLGYLLTLSSKIFIIGLTAILSILIIYTIQINKNRNKSKEGFHNLINNSSILADPSVFELNRNNFSKSTQENPLMNVLIPEVYYNPERKPAAPTFNPVVEKEINNNVQDFVCKQFSNNGKDKKEDKKIKQKLFGDLGAELNFDRSMQRFTANPNTIIPNDQKSFQDFCYGDMISGKEGHPLALERNSSGAYNYTNY